MLYLIRKFLFLMTLYFGVWVPMASAQDLTVSTVTRPPFSMVENGASTGFSLELLDALAEPLGWTYEVQRFDLFTDMLDAVTSDAADMAIANISITAARESRLDFSQPIFESGLQIMVKSDTMRSPSLWRAVAKLDLLAAIGVAFLLLMGGGMLMWVLERRAQPYFDRPVQEAWFPSFWWALNLVVNGGFEERVPRTFLGRIFAVSLVIASLFVVSVFVARITSAMTIEAITGTINSVNDLYGQRVATIENSTAAAFLTRREIDFDSYGALDTLLTEFEAGKIDAVVFDAPILSYYTHHDGRDIGQMTGAVFLRESYGIAFPTGSPLVEDVNQSLLSLRENGTYDEIYKRWFGSGY